MKKKNSNDGKQLEALVAFVEGLHLPEGYKIETNKGIYENGKQLCELDVLVTGKFGTTDIAWLIECRDRPSKGSAPGSWIEQLASRKNLLQLSKVTAVSTTGFSASAKSLASKFGVELREVKELSPENFSFLPDTLIVLNNQHELRNVNIELDSALPAEQKKFMEELLSQHKNSINNLFIKAKKSGEKITLFEAFIRTVGQLNLFAEILPDQPQKNVQIPVRYTDDYHFVIESPYGDIRIFMITFEGGLSLKIDTAPMSHFNYSQTQNKEIISQYSISNVNINDAKLSLQIHADPKSGNFVAKFS